MFRSTHHRRTLRAAATAVLLAAFLIVIPASAARAAAPDTISAGVIDDWPPYYMRGSHGQPAGFAIDLLDAVSARANLVPRYRVYPSFMAMQNALEAGEIDVIPNFGVVPDRHVLFTSSVGAFDVGIFVRKSSPHITSHADLHGKIAVVENNIGVRLTEQLPNLEPIVYHDVREALFRLLSGDVDALLFPSEVIWSLARSAHVDHLITDVPPALAEVKRAIGVAPERADLLVRLDLALEDFIGTPEYAALYLRWHGQPEPFWTPRRVAIVALLVLALVVLAGAIYRYVVIRRARERIRFHAHLLDIIGESVIATDVGGKIIFWNRFAEQMYGWSADEATGRVITELIVPQNTQEQAAEIMAALRAGKAWQGEFATRRRDGRVFPVFATSEPILDRAGRVVGIVGVSTDLTERKSLEQQLLQAQKMESIGRLAGGVAHDFNNLLTVISGTTEVVMAELPEGDRHRADLIEVRRASQRAAELTQQLLAFSRKQVSQPQVLNLNDTLRESERMLRRLMGEDVTLVVRPGDGSGNVRVDPTQLQQVLLNLAVNARDAMPRGGRLTVETSTVVLDAIEAQKHPGLEPGEYVRMTVADTGVGMDEATSAHVFEPFFTTKPPGAGTGLGLATVYGIVKQSGGAIEVQSTPGAGARFHVYLPRVAGTAGDAREAPPERLHLGSETVLVVEDEPGVRDLVFRTLSASGYKVLVAGSASEALRLGAAHEGPIHLLLTDVVMPGMHGPALAAEITTLRPETRVLYMSGYADTRVPGPDERGAGTLITKPFALDALERTVRKLLDEGTVGAGNPPNA